MCLLLIFINIIKDIVRFPNKLLFFKNSILKRGLITYYVVAQTEKGLNNLYYYAIDYTLGTIFLGYYLLFIFNYYLLKIDVNRSYNFLHINSENNNKPVIINNSINNTNTQSAENCKEFSETIRQLSNFNQDKQFFK